MWIARLLNLALILILMHVFVFDHRSQPTRSPNNLARFTLLTPKAGLRKQFDDGYKRHLNWHIEKKDPWNWYGWYISSGKRLGVFVDATFGRSWADFDNPLDPGGDRADLNINVIPFVTLTDQFTCTFLPEHSNFAKADLEARYQRVISVGLHPGQEVRFREFLGRFARAMPEVAPKQKFGWFRIEDGDGLPSYFVMLPKRSFAEFGRTDGLFAQILESAPSGQAPFRESVKEIGIETMSYRADLTYVPDRD